MVIVICWMHAAWRLSEWIAANRFQSRHLGYFWNQYPTDDRPLQSDGYHSCCIPLRPWFRILARRLATLIETFLLLSFDVRESCVKDNKIAQLRKLSTAPREHMGCGGIYTSSVMISCRKKLTWILNFGLGLLPSVCVRPRCTLVKRMDDMIFMQRLRIKKFCTCW
jgi:hypothetical protein